MDDPEVSEGASENEYSEHEQDEPDSVGKEEDDSTDMAESKIKSEGGENGKAGSTGTTKPKLDPKDPLRPRRKKARRACFACQRAHLTCGMFASLRMNQWLAFRLCPAQLTYLPLRSQIAANVCIRRRAPLSALHQTWPCRCLSRRSKKEGKVSSRCSS